MDMARTAGIHIDREKLSTLLGRLPILETVGNREQGIQHLIDTIVRLSRQTVVNEIDQPIVRGSL